MESNEPMEPTSPMESAPVEQPPPRQASRVKTLLAGLAIAGLLTGAGAMSAFAASPQPSSSGAPTASDDSSGSGSGSGANHVCPDRGTDGSNSGSSSDSSSST